MELRRFRFGEQAGPNGKMITFNGWLSVFEQEPGRCHVEIAGPNGGVRSGVIIDKATAGQLGAALLAWADGAHETEGRAFSKTVAFVEKDPLEVKN